MTRMTVNGEALRFALDPETPLLFALRDAANLTAAKYGCDTRDCGVCTVMVDGQAALSCAVSIGALEGAEVVTLEALSDHPLKQAWAKAQVSQCGYCEPGMIMALVALLRTSPKPLPAEFEAIGNICRCGIGPRVLQAVRLASAARASAGGIVPTSLSNGSSDSEQSAP